MAFNYSPKIVTNGLVLYLDAANPNSYISGSTKWNDLSGNNNNATLTNGPTFSTSNGGVIVFDGVNDYALIPGSGSILSNLSTYTVELMIKAPHTGNKVVLEKSANAKMLIQPGNTSNGLLYGDYTAYADASPILNNTWINICIVQASTYRKLYINANLKNTTNLGNSPSNASNIVLMSRSGGFAQQGNVSFFKIYNIILSDIEIQQNFNATKTRFGL